MYTVIKSLAILLLLVGVVVFVGCEAIENGNNTQDPVEEPAVEEVLLYFCDSEGHLTEELREVQESEDLPRRAVEELIAGPMDEELFPTIPEETVLIGVSVEEGVARADFSEELRTNHWGGSLGEILTVYAIVNTLAQFSEIDTVQVLIDGQPQETLVGHMDLSRPLQPDWDLIKE